MREYLTDEHFGELAARVLAFQWFEANQPKDDKKFGSGEDFSRVEERREARAADPAATSAEAEAIFGAIDTLIVDGSTDAQMKLGVARSEEHTSELQSLMRISYAVFCLKKKKHT